MVSDSKALTPVGFNNFDCTSVVMLLFIVECLLFLRELVLMFVVMLLPDVERREALNL